MSKYFHIINLLRNERRSLDELINLQNIALQKLVKHAYNTVDFYKKLFDEQRINPNDIRSVEDITKLPIISKEMFNTNPVENFISNAFRKQDLMSIRTSGSTGIPLEFFIDCSLDQYRKAQFLRPYLTNGKRLRDNSLSFSYHPTVKKKKWFQNIGLMVDHTVFPGLNLDDQIKTIQNVKPKVIRGYGSILNLLANKIADENLTISKPRLIFTDSETLFADSRENIQKFFGVPVVDVYGTWETDNIAYECRHHSGYHIAIDSVIMEFLKNGKSVKANEDGEIVVTVLNNFAMPFIRYNLHDIGSYRKEVCPCGRTFPLMNQIKGRKNDFMIGQDGKKILFFDHYLRGVAPHVYEYQIIQEELNLFTVFIVPGKSYSGEGEKTFLPVMKKFFPNARININLVSSIVREPSGKFKVFISKVSSL